MTEAAARGIIDFSEAQLDDPRWHRRVRYLLAGMGRLRRRELLDKIHTSRCSMLAISKLSGDGLKALEESRQDTLEALCDTYTPWDKRDKKEEEKAEARGFRSRWKNKFGDLDDPEVQKRIDDFAAAMREQAEQGARQVAKAASSTLYNKDTAAAF